MACETAPPVGGIARERTEDERAVVDEFHVFCKRVGVEFAAEPFLNGPFVVSDVADPKEPVVFASEGFLRMTGYRREEIVGRKCGLLQGQRTHEGDVALIRELVAKREEGFVRLWNHRKDGSCFLNILYIAPLRRRGAAGGADADEPVRYMIGCQCDPSSRGRRGSLELSPTAPEYNAACRSNVRIRGGAAGCGDSFLSDTEIVPNAGVVHVHNDFIAASAFVKTRTHPAVDPRVARYFDGRRRNFEMQVQFELAHDCPAEKLFLNAFLDNPMELGMATWAMVKIIVGLLKKMGPKGTTVAFGDEKRAKSKRAAIAIPLVHAADEIIVSKPGTAHPGLGINLVYTDGCSGGGAGGDKEAVKAVRQQVLRDGYKAGWTYTIAFYSMYVDLEQWRVCNLPGVKTIALERFWGAQSLHVGLAVLPDDADAPELQSKGRDLFYLDVVHASLPHF